MHKRKLWRPQLRLSTILLLMTLIAVGVAWWADHKQSADRIRGLEQQRNAFKKAYGVVEARLKLYQPKIVLPYIGDDPNGPWEPWNHKWDEYNTRLPDPAQHPDFRQ